ncbi:hypothetical protein BmR1_04g08665 [Babesia microti strain RI]|uniref:Uncharacterized protein n=1 Tax=Babesia microti (strain RI) TaxID=1133968 RepID=I7JDM7_BABMR|nr:hypothetical protein BmR1_04g08665 [Babesia microti strain RI]CCF75910.1 hypothetical protein BmR1_04g08665 [Babesia microti strain RI]|eukprot:XP_012650318.1 hypothetical protein BmR1_04g08665 [Babesia microti strain RI]
MNPSVTFSLEPYGPGDCRLLRYLPGGFPVYEDACREGSVNAWKNAAQSLCLAASLWASPPKPRDWELAGIARIEANKYLTSGCKLMDLMLGTTNMERGKKLMSTEPIDVDKTSDDICKSSYNASLSEMLIGMTARDQLLEMLIDRCNKIAGDFDTESHTLNLSKTFICICQQLRQYFKISRIYKHYVDVDCTDIDFCCTCQVYINLDIYNPLRISNNPTLYPYPPSVTSSVVATLKMIDHDRWNLEFYGHLCKFIQKKYFLVAKITYNGTTYSSYVINGKIDLSQVLTNETAKHIHKELIAAQMTLMDKVILELVSIGSLEWDNDIVQLVDMDPDNVCFHIDIPQLNGRIAEFTLSYESSNDNNLTPSNGDKHALELLMTCVIYKIRDLILHEWEIYVFDAANRFADIAVHWKSGKIENTDILSQMFNYLLPKLTAVLSKLHPSVY